MKRTDQIEINAAAGGGGTMYSAPNAAKMKIFPAIDILDGKAVRLLRGDYDKVTVYGDDLVMVGRKFADEGAECIHMVDLGGARDGGSAAFDVICAVKAATNLFCHVGGGIRNDETVRKYLDAGIDRVIIGTAAIRDRKFLMRAVGKWGDRIAVGIDARDGKVATDGWRSTSEVDAVELCCELAESGVRTFICTDISKDGAMQGTNREFYARLIEALTGRMGTNAGGVEIIASGGVGSVDDIKALASLGVAGAIIGRAYYTGAITIADAIAAAENGNSAGGGK